MWARRTTLLVIVGVLICSPAAAFSPAPPQRRDIFSHNRRFDLDADPKAGVNTVYAANDRSTPLWSFPGTLWLADALLSNDGAVVVVIQWPFIKVDYLDEAGALWFKNREGVFRSYTVAELCPHPRRTKDIGPGPVGEFWRTWRTACPRVVNERDEFEVETTGGWTYTFRLADGALMGRRVNDWAVYLGWLWAAVLGVPTAVMAGFVVWRRRRPTWPRERRALAWAGVASAATLCAALLTSLGLASWVQGSVDFTRDRAPLRAIHRSPDARACWYAGVAVSVAVSVAAAVYTFIWLGVGRVGKRAVVPGTSAPPAVPGAPPPPAAPA